MGKLIGLLIILTLVSSCGVPFGKDVKRANRGESRQFSTTNPEFTDIIAEFKKDGVSFKENPGFSQGDVPINFGDTEDPKFDGVCIIYSNGQREILIKQSWWKTADSAQRQILVYHELGHCSLDREHDETTIRVGNADFKLSIMNPVIPSSSAFTDSDRKEGYLDELFNNTKTKITAAYTILINQQ